MKKELTIQEAIKELKDEEFLDESDKEIFLEYLTDPSVVLMEMANFVGNKVRVEPNLPFSFFISDKQAARGKHAIRAKIIWNPTKAPDNADGYIMLHGDYEYFSGSHKYKPTAKELNVAKTFFKKYKVLFAAVWEGILDADPLQDYMKGNITFKELLTKFELKGKKYFDVNHAKDIVELESVIRQNKIFNLND